MKTLHDLKNPVYSLLSIVNDTKLPITELRTSANSELEDISEMLDNLKVEFKSRYQMDYKEEKRDIKITDFLEHLSRAHIRLANNGNNHFSLQAEQNMPKFIRIPKLTVMRVCNNLITNSMKHTKNGTVTVNCRESDIKDLHDNS